MDESAAIERAQQLWTRGLRAEALDLLKGRIRSEPT